jgi:hypothetical protein
MGVALRKNTTKNAAYFRSLRPRANGPTLEQPGPQADMAYRFIVQPRLITLSRSSPQAKGQRPDPRAAQSAGRRPKGWVWALIDQKG